MIFWLNGTHILLSWIKAKGNWFKVRIIICHSCLTINWLVLLLTRKNDSMLVCCEWIHIIYLMMSFFHTAIISKQYYTLTSIPAHITSKINIINTNEWMYEWMNAQIMDKFRRIVNDLAARNIHYDGVNVNRQQLTAGLLILIMRK